MFSNLFSKFCNIALVFDLRINSIVSSSSLYKSSYDITVFTYKGEKEIGFKSLEICKKIIDANNIIDEYCHSDADIYMMSLLANITKFGYIHNIKMRIINPLVNGERYNK